MTTVLEEITESKQLLQKQGQEYLTIDQIMPKWSHCLDLLNAEIQDFEAIAYWKMDHDLDMGEYNRCMSAEANGFTDDYHYGDVNGAIDKYCIVCERYAQTIFPGFLADVEGRGLYIGRDWRDNLHIKNFVTHWNLNHIINNNSNSRGMK